MMWRYEVLTALAVGAAVVALAQIAEAGDTHGSGGNRNGNHSSVRSQSFNFQGGSSKYQSSFSQNKKSSHHDHHSHHGHHHQGRHHQPYPLVVRYPYPQPYPVAVPVPVAPPIVTTIPQGGANLVDGVNLQSVDVRMVDNGDTARQLGPRFRVVIGNRGKQAAGNFQVLAIAAKEAKFTADLPATMVEVEGIAPGQVAKLDVRLPIRAMTMIEGQPYNILAVMVDSKKLIEETAEQDNSGLMERAKIELLDAR